MRYKGVTKFMAGLLAAAMVVTGIPVATLDTAEAKSKTEKLSYKGYTKVWEDNFDGNSLNMKDWNVETHEPGWVNAELQEYTESGNIKVSDGKLTIIPKRTKNADGTYSYTSGRINTQNKHDFKYGIMEARMKFPKGQGYLPAFWMMPTNENLYGQWPKCGEIDIMEVLGNDLETGYCTIHYGEPHAEQQGTFKFDAENLANEFHDYSVEWEPGEMRFYIDENLVLTCNDWFTAVEGEDDKPYPAPFNQPFFVQMNLAVGGNWPGDPDETTDFENAEFVIDYVRVYQKSEYDTNVSKPVAEFRAADETGNFIINGDFAEAEDLSDDENWKFMLFEGGEGAAEIKDNSIVITTEKEGSVDYSVQLVQPDLPMIKGKKYRVSFDAYADENRDIIVCVSAPTAGWVRYLEDTVVPITTEKQTFTFDFDMTMKDDNNGRLEFNLGNKGSTATVYISNVRVEEVSE